MSIAPLPDAAHPAVAGSPDSTVMEILGDRYRVRLGPVRQALVVKMAADRVDLETLADRIGRCRQTLWRFVRKGRPVSVPTLFAILAFVGIEFTDIAEIVS